MEIGEYNERMAAIKQRNMAEHQADLDRIAGYFREGMDKFLAHGDREEMIKFAAAYAQEKDWPEQARIAKVHMQNRMTLARHDL
jgi:hypothetical protein